MLQPRSGRERQTFIILLPLVWFEPDLRETLSDAFHLAMKNKQEKYSVHAPLEISAAWLYAEARDYIHL